MGLESQARQKIMNVLMTEYQGWNIHHEEEILMLEEDSDE